MKTKKIKVCFGRYEDNNNSWHCKGCIIAKECKEYQEVKLCRGQVKIRTT